jgi:predicted DNA-binding protein
VPLLVARHESHDVRDHCATSAVGFGRWAPMGGQPSIWYYGAMAKVTFTLDDETVRAIRMLAERRNKPQSAVVREAVAVYVRQEETLDDTERVRRLRVLDHVMARPRTRPQAEVDRELREIRRSRRAGWQRPSD